MRVVPLIAGEHELDRAIRHHYYGEVALAEEQPAAPRNAPRPSALVESEALLEQAELEAPAFTAAELKRLAILKDNQEKSAQILRTVRALLKDKGVL